ncbi:hypothetical protein M0R45_030627 [Rubus argutus]|uniref:Uncharacterized protein n=1 Tax=Rubus argutus TaxID=59490 RepID=A0AAW1WBP1_RUBAR
MLQFHFAHLTLPLETKKWLPLAPISRLYCPDTPLVITTQPSDSAISLKNDKITTGSYPDSGAISRSEL